MFSYSKNAVPDQQTKPEPEPLPERVSSLRPMPHTSIPTSAVPHFLPQKKKGKVIKNTSTPFSA